MPPQQKITKEAILEAALQLLREEGQQAINARALAKRLDCSTQPIFSNYSSMEALKEQVILSAKALYQDYLKKGMENPAYPPYKASGMTYIRFAREERELFKLLFMRDRSLEEIKEEREEIAPLLQLIAANTGMSLENAYFFHLEMWIYAHGIAVMSATAYLDWDWDTISRMMTDVYSGIKERFLSKDAPQPPNIPPL